MRYALINPQGQIDRFGEKIDPSVATKPGFKWLPCPEVARPAFDPFTQAVSLPQYAVGEKAVVEAYTVRDLTAPELDVLKEAKLGRLDDLQWEGLFLLENRVRVLEGKAPITQAVYRASVKARL